MAQHLSGPPSLTGQVALITGGSGGMGRAIANAFKTAGAFVVATDLREHEDIGPGIEYRRYVRPSTTRRLPWFSRVAALWEVIRRGFMRRWHHRNICLIGSRVFQSEQLMPRSLPAMRLLAG